MNTPDEKWLSAQREEMVQKQIEGRGIQDVRVCAAMRKVLRHRFLDSAQWTNAYEDRALQVGPEQTLSQPYIVARMLEKLRPSAGERILEIGTGTGYQTALLAELVSQVFSVELDPELAGLSRARLDRMGYKNINISTGNGWDGWPEHSPYDLIIVSAAAPLVPRALIRQLSARGRLLLPLGDEEQSLVYFEKTADGLVSEEMETVRFVPLQGQPEEEESE